MFTRIAEHLHVYQDTCNVYVLRSGRDAVLIDFGSGDVLDHLAEIGVDRVTDVLMTHHHRDQAQGLRRAAEVGAAIWVPQTEQDLFQDVDAHWQAREVFNNYNVRQDRFSPLESIPVAGVLEDYECRPFGDFLITVLPTPGHTPGSISLMAEVDGRPVLFSGDLISAPGKVTSISATQWSYNGAEGVAASLASLLDLQERRIDLLLPSHGRPMEDPHAAIALLAERFWKLLQLRRQNSRLLELRAHPYRPALNGEQDFDGRVTPHLLMNRTSVANSYVLLSQSGKALFIDFGYDFMTGFAGGTDRASRRPWLYTLPALKSQFGVQKIDAVLLTHYHDDHVAGCNMLRRVEGAEVWAAETFAAMLEDPARYDLPCIWYDAIPVDRSLPLRTPIDWEEYTLTLHPLPGHTRYAVAIELEVDGLRFLATGDQYQGDDALVWNYVYRNRYAVGDYTASSKRYQQIAPDVILSGHKPPFRVTPEYLERIVADAEILDSLHRDLLPESPDLGAEGVMARILPYQVTVAEGETVTFEVELRNPFPSPEKATLQVVAPEGWQVDGGLQTWDIADMNLLSFQVTPPAGAAVRRARLAVDISIDGQRFGQQAEALITVVPALPVRPQVAKQAQSTVSPQIVIPQFGAPADPIGQYREPDVS